jgi:hypothetical protein
MRRAARLQRDRLAVENELGDAARSHGLDDLGRGRGHVVAIAREDPDVVAGLVDLHACAIQLPLERGGAERLQRGSDIGGGLGEHRRHRLHQRQRELREAGCAFGQNGERDGNDAVRDHRRLPDGGRGQRCLRPQPRRSSTIRGRPWRSSPSRRRVRKSRSSPVGAREERSESAVRAPFEPAPLVDAMRASAESTSQISSEAASAAGCRLRIAQERIADAAPALPGFAGEIRDGRFDFSRGELAEAVGEQRGLGVAACSFGDPARCCYELGQKRHPAILRDDDVFDCIGRAHRRRMAPASRIAQQFDPRLRIDLVVRARRDARSHEIHPQPIAGRKTYLEVPAIDDGKPEAAGWHRVQRRIAMLVERDLDAGDLRQRADILDLPWRRMPPAHVVPAEQHDAVAVATTPVRVHPLAPAHKGEREHRPTRGHTDPATDPSRVNALR